MQTTRLRARRQHHTIRRTQLIRRFPPRGHGIIFAQPQERQSPAAHKLVPPMQPAGLVDECGREEFALAGAAEHGHKDGGEDGVEYDIEGLDGRDDSRRKALSAVAVDATDVGYGVQIGPDCDGGPENADGRHGTQPNGVVAAPHVVYVCDMCALDEEELH